MRSRITSLAPFIYLGQHVRPGAGKTMDTIGQRNCYTLWEQYDGVTLLEHDGDCRRIEPGNVFLAKPGTSARWVATARATRLVFDLAPRRRRLNDRGLAFPVRWTPQPSWKWLFGVPLEPLISEPWAQQAHDIISFGLHTDQRRAPLRWLEVGMLLGRWVVRYAGRLGETMLASSGERPALTLVQRAEVLLAGCLNPRKTTDEVAKMLGVSRIHLSRVFKEVRGHGPGHARLLCQIRKAQQLMLGFDHSLTTVAHLTGFASARGLRHAFKKLVGMSPSRWRRQHGSP
jgi:AraC-like DNA-binding protein